MNAKDLVDQLLETRPRRKGRPIEPVDKSLFRFGTSREEPIGNLAQEIELIRPRNEDPIKPVNKNRLKFGAPGHGQSFGVDLKMVHGSDDLDRGIATPKNEVEDAVEAVEQAISRISGLISRGVEAKIRGKSTILLKLKSAHRDLAIVAELVDK